MSPAAELQNYDERRPWVREIADFLGRSPGSISFHLGNIASAKSPGQGLEHAGKVFEIAVDRYQGNPRELQLEAARLRRAKFSRLASPRLESDLTEEEALVAQAELERRFPEARLPPDTIILYRYKGSVWLGVMATIQTALMYPQETAKLFRVALDVLGSNTKRNPAAESALDGRTIELAEREIVEPGPKVPLQRTRAKRPGHTRTSAPRPSFTPSLEGQSSPTRVLLQPRLARGASAD